MKRRRTSSVELPVRQPAPPDGAHEESATPALAERSPSPMKHAPQPSKTATPPSKSSLKKTKTTSTFSIPVSSWSIPRYPTAPTIDTTVANVANTAPIKWIYYSWAPYAGSENTLSASQWQTNFAEHCDQLSSSLQPNYPSPARVLDFNASVQSQRERAPSPPGNESKTSIPVHDQIPGSTVWPLLKWAPNVSLDKPNDLDSSLAPMTPIAQTAIASPTTDPLPRQKRVKIVLPFSHPGKGERNRRGIQLDRSNRDGAYTGDSRWALPKESGREYVNASFCDWSWKKYEYYRQAVDQGIEVEGLNGSVTTVQVPASDDEDEHEEGSEEGEIVEMEKWDTGQVAVGGFEYSDSEVDQSPRGCEESSLDNLDQEKSTGDGNHRSNDDSMLDPLLTPSGNYGWDKFERSQSLQNPKDNMEKNLRIGSLTTSLGNYGWDKFKRDSQSPKDDEEDSSDSDPEWKWVDEAWKKHKMCNGFGEP